MKMRADAGLSTRINVTQGENALPLSRQKILDGAVRVAIRDGILAITLDAVAKEAGVSKGGLIHHFRSKDDLISSMLEHFRSRVVRTMDEREAADGNPRGRWFRAMVGMVLEPAVTDDSAESAPPDMSRFFIALLAAAANNPQLLDPLRRSMIAVRQRLLGEGANGLRQVALWPAILGLLLWQHLGVISPDDPLCRSMINELLSLAEGPDSPAPGLSSTSAR